MCLPKPKADRSAEIAAKREAERQQRIQEGRTGIEQAFAGFDEPFFEGYQQQYLDYYNPQLRDQYSDAVKRLTLQLAQTRNLTGSVGADQLADLKQFYDQQNLALTNQALERANRLRGDIDQRRSQLFAENRAAADPGGAAASAATAAQALQPAPPTSPLANVFSDFFGNLGNVAALSNVRRLREGTGVQQFGGGSGKSVYEVN